MFPLLRNITFHYEEMMQYQMREAGYVEISIRLKKISKDSVCILLSLSTESTMKALPEQ